MAGAMVVAYHGERPEEAEAAWQLSSTAAGLLWPGRLEGKAFAACEYTWHAFLTLL